jgi:hypothetical protein
MKPAKVFVIASVLKSLGIWLSWQAGLIRKAKKG